MSAFERLSEKIIKGFNELFDVMQVPSPGDPDNERAVFVRNAEGRYVPIPLSVIAKCAASYAQREPGEPGESINEHQFKQGYLKGWLDGWDKKR